MPPKTALPGFLYHRTRLASERKTLQASPIFPGPVFHLPKQQAGARRDTRALFYPAPPNLFTKRLVNILLYRQTYSRQRPRDVLLRETGWVGCLVVVLLGLQLARLQSLEHELAGGDVVVVVLQALAEVLLVHVAGVDRRLLVSLGRLPKSKKERKRTGRQISVRNTSSTRCV